MSVWDMTINQLINPNKKFYIFYFYMYFFKKKKKKKKKEVEDSILYFQTEGRLGLLEGGKLVGYQLSMNCQQIFIDLPISSSSRLANQRWLKYIEQRQIPVHTPASSLNSFIGCTLVGCAWLVDWGFPPRLLPPYGGVYCLAHEAPL